MKKWIQEHLVASGIVVSCLFALILHILFEIEAPNEWFDPEWEAGDILTYASTVALGLLALWQNQRFKEENDKSQERLERISLAANDLSIIIRFAENESQYIEVLERAFDELINAISIERISVILGKRDCDKEEICAVLGEINRALRKMVAISASGYEIREHRSDSLIKECSRMADAVSAAVKKGKVSYLDELIEPYIDLCINVSQYLAKRRALQNMILLEQFSIETIRNIYVFPSMEQDDSKL